MTAGPSLHPRYPFSGKGRRAGAGPHAWYRLHPRDRHAFAAVRSPAEGQIVSRRAPALAVLALFVATAAGACAQPAQPPAFAADTMLADPRPSASVSSEGDGVPPPPEGADVPPVDPVQDACASCEDFVVMPKEPPPPCVDGAPGEAHEQRCQDRIRAAWAARGRGFRAGDRPWDAALRSVSCARCRCVVDVDFRSARSRLLGVRLLVQGEKDRWAMLPSGKDLGAIPESGSDLSARIVVDVPPPSGRACGALSKEYDK